MSHLARDIETVVFDLGGVVCQFQPERRLAALAESTGLSRVFVTDAVWSSGLDAAADRGDFDLASNVDAVLAALRNRLDRRDLLVAWARAFEPDENVLAIVRRINCRVAILTNNGPLLEECCRVGLVELDDAFDRVIFSWRLRAVKPEGVAFERAATLLGVAPHRLLLIDDNESHVRAARNAGWQAITYVGADDLTGLLQGY